MESGERPEAGSETLSPWEKEKERLFLTGLFADLPEAALGAIVVHAVIGLIRFGPIARLRSRNRVDFWAAVTTLLGVLVLDVLAGLHRGRNRRPLAETVLRLLDAVRAHAGIAIWPTGEQALANCLRVVDLARRFERRGAPSFRAFVDRLEGDAERGREVTVLDGDVVRTHLSKGLGFSREDRDTNVRRIGFVAAEVVRHGGLAVAAVVSPYRATRAEVREMVGEGYIEVYMDTPLEVVEERDVKGWYAKARSGEVKEFTGVSDPYEPPTDPELTLTTTDTTALANARLVVDYLESRGILAPA